MKKLIIFLLLCTSLYAQHGNISVVDSLELDTGNFRPGLSFTWSDTIAVIMSYEYVEDAHFDPTLHLLDINADYSIDSEIDQEEHTDFQERYPNKPSQGFATSCDSLAVFISEINDGDLDGTISLKEIDLGDGDLVAGTVDDLEFETGDNRRGMMVALPDHTDYWIIASNAGGTDGKFYMVHRDGESLVLDDTESSGEPIIPNRIFHIGDSIVVAIGIRTTSTDSLGVMSAEVNPDGGDQIQAINTWLCGTMSDAIGADGYHVTHGDLGDSRKLFFSVWINTDSTAFQFASFGVDSATGAIDDAFIDSVYTDVYGVDPEAIGQFIGHPGNTKLGLLTWRDTSDDYYLSTIDLDADGTNIRESFIETYLIGTNTGLAAVAHTDPHETSATDSLFIVTFIDSDNDMWVKTVTVGREGPFGWQHKMNTLLAPDVNTLDNTEISKVNTLVK